MKKGIGKKTQQFKALQIKAIEYEESIESLAREITKAQAIDIEKLLSQYGKNELMELIQYILAKRQKSQDDVTVLIEYLKTIKEFTTSIQENNDDTFLQNVLNKLVKSLAVQLVSNSILFKIGEKGAHFYIILKGSISILMPEEIKRHLTPDEYLAHVIFLYQMNETELLNKTLLANKKIYNVDMTNPFHPMLTNYANKSVNEDFVPRRPKGGTVDDYLEDLIPVSTQTEKSYHPFVSIWKYHIIITLGRGRTFGEQALISKKNLRTATVFGNEDTVLGVLNEIDFASSIKSIQIQTKNDNILFIMRYNIFGDISFDFFTKQFWNNFILIKLKYGDMLFHQNGKREMIYFIKKGEFDLTCKLSQNEINSILIYFGVNQTMLRNEYSSDKQKPMKICTIKTNTILGVDDVLFPSKGFFCTAHCSSKTAELFCIDTQKLNDIIEFANSSKALNKIIAEKMKIMIDRLLGFKRIEKIVYSKDSVPVVQEVTLPPISTRSGEFSKMQINLVKNQMKIVNMGKLKHKLKLEQSELNEGKSIHKKINTNTLDALTLPNTSIYKPAKTPLNNYTMKGMTDERKEKNSHSYLNTELPTKLDIKYEPFDFKTSLRIKSMMEKPQVIELYTTSLFENKSKINTLKNQMDKKYPNRNIIYSKIVLNPDYSISATHDVHTMMDFCITEETNL